MGRLRGDRRRRRRRWTRLQGLARLVGRARRGRSASSATTSGSSFSHNYGGAVRAFPRPGAPVRASSRLVVVGLIVVVPRALRRNLYLSVALGLLLGGAVGNLIDRLRLGYVVDWVDIGLGDLPLLHLQRRRRGRSASAILLLLGLGPLPEPRRPAGSPARMPDGVTVAGPRTLRVPDGPSGRVDRFVADATGLSRSYVQRLISEAG